MPRTLRVKELLRHSGAELGTSRWLPVDQPRIDAFAEATEDRQWIHVDTLRAGEGPYGTTIAHGYLTLSLVPRLVEDVLTLSDQAHGVNYGIDRLRFLAPVRSGSRLRLHARLVDAEQRDDGGVRYRLDVRLETSPGERPALVATLVYVAYDSG